MRIEPRSGLLPLVAGVAATAALLTLSGCGALRRIQVFPVSIVNDTAAPVVARGCSHYCSSSLLTFELAPGAGAVVNRATNMHKRFSITTPTGTRLGCLDLYFTKPQAGARMLVSNAVACPRGSRGRWKLVGLVLAAGLVVLVAFALARSPRDRA